MKVARLKKAERVNQIYEWLSDKFPTPYPTKLKLIRVSTDESKNLYGWVELKKRVLIITLDERYPRHLLIETLIHEMAHACTWVNRRMEPHVDHHSDEWGLQYAKIYRAFFDEDGKSDSGKY
jgi:hypothetical protein